MFISRINFWLCHPDVSIWATLAIILMYISLSVVGTANFPILDDFELLHFLNQWKEPTDTATRIKLLFEPHNEHRIVITRLIFLLDEFLFGNLNFKRIVFYCTLFQLGAFMSFISLLREYYSTRTLLHSSPFVIIFVAIAFFHTGSAESMLWAMAGVQSSAFLLVLFLSFKWLMKGTPRAWLLAIFFAALAPFSQGNGLLLPPVLLVFFVNKKQWIPAVLSLIVVMMHVFLFLNKPASAPLIISKEMMIPSVVFSFAFLGSALAIGGNNFPTLTAISLIPSTALGILVWAIVVWAVMKKENVIENPFFWVVLVFIGTSVLAALTRVQLGLSQLWFRDITFIHR